MRLDRDLERWSTAGLIDSRTANAIRAFEAARVPDDQRRVIWIAASLAGLAIALGLVAVLASNWDVIPGAVKIVVDLALLGGLAAGMVRVRSQGPAWAFEVLLLAFVGLVLASLGLVVQQTQIDLHFPWMSLAWLVLVTPVWLHGRASFTHGVFVTAVLVTWFALLGELPDDRPWAGSLTPLLAMSAPLVLVVAAQLAVSRGHERFAQAATVFGWGGLVLAASFGTTAFYGGRPLPWDDPDARTWLLGWAVGTAWIVLLTAMAVSAAKVTVLPTGAPRIAAASGAFPQPDGEAPMDRATRARRGLLLVSAACISLPLVLVPGESLPTLAAIVFLAYWVWLGRCVVQVGRPALLDAIAVVIGIRLLIAYAEVFGSLLDTGLALIGGGLLALLLILAWVRRREAIAAAATDETMSPREDGGQP
jgi:uncharacterized membrane protein